MCFDKDKKNISSKSRMTETKSTSKIIKKQDTKKVSSFSHQPSRKQPRKGENPTRLVPPPDQSSDFGHSNTWICKNAACRAVLSIDDTFCRRCSCCICHHFDDNKDPSLWLVCSSESTQGDSCGLSCHIECALQHEKVGVVDHGQLMQLDGGYCCASCGKVTGILGCWKKQLNIAKDARRVDVLCYRIYLSYRLLDGTSKFKDLHQTVQEAKTKLETEVGPVNGVSAKMARGIVSRLPIASDIQKLCSLAIEKADSWLATVPNVNPDSTGGSLPAACKFIFEEVTTSSVKIILIEMSNTCFEEIKGYKLWYYKSREELPTKDPVSLFPKYQRRILISNLKPCTQYTFRIISYTDTCDLGHSEAKCFTKSIEIIKNNPSSIPEAQLPSVSRGLDLNVVSVPDLNEELTPPFEYSRDEDNGCSLLQAVEADDDAASHDLEKNGLARSHGSGDSQTWAHGPAGEVSAVDSRIDMCRRKRIASTIEETHDCDSTLINGSPLRISDGSCTLDENFEYCVKVIRWLECEGHIKQEFRLKLLTWFSLRATEQERRVVNTFIQTLIDDPSSLAGQLVDSFSDIISNKRQRNGFCSKAVASN
uniref:Protein VERNALIZATION INSENSITIVE 3 n=1 Tax=Cajanus cajan TaxID=3821 RepID=A0A151T3H4_CAJCA|nr:Protein VERNALIZATION INSENSITIVE 3 [Cajanus cajan]